MGGMFAADTLQKTQRAEVFCCTNATKLALYSALDCQPPTHLGGGISLSIYPALRNAALSHNAPVGNWCQLCGGDSPWAAQNGVGAGHNGRRGVGRLHHGVHLVCWGAAAGRNGCGLHTTRDRTFLVMAVHNFGASCNDGHKQEMYRLHWWCSGMRTNTHSR